jgi:hypothetical protein
MEGYPMRKVFFASIVMVMILSGVLIGGRSAPAQASESTILEFGTMVGIPQAFTGTQAPIRGINGGGLPWMLTSARGELKASGKLEVSVQGLVLAAGANAGSNPVANFRVTVSCLRDDASVQNVTSGLFPATTGPATAGGGNANIETTLALPQPCLAPLVFVTSPAGSWFAVTGK